MSKEKTPSTPAPELLGKWKSWRVELNRLKNRRQEILYVIGALSSTSAVSHSEEEREALRKAIAKQKRLLVAANLAEENHFKGS